MNKRIGWVPWCTGDEDFSRIALGPWPAFFGTVKRTVQKDVRKNHGFRFKILPVFVKKP